LSASSHASSVDWAGVGHPTQADGARIACLVPSLTELLFALGLGDRVVARTGFCVHPRDAVRAVPKIGGTKNPDLAKLRALAPTHLVVNVDENRREDVDAAREFVPHIVVTHPMSPEENLRLYRLFGVLFDRAREAETLVERFEDAFASLASTASALPRENALYLIWRNPWMTVARDTYVSATLARAGIDTVPAQSNVRYPALAEDAPAWQEASRILLSTEPYAFRERDAKALAQSRQKPVHLIDGEWTSWYGVRAIEGLRALAAFRQRVAFLEAGP
jgi:ABC-type Fe3+-hydroxamate transport system substrate-binding protein